MRPPDQFSRAGIGTGDLGGWARLFLRYPSPRIILAWLAAVLAARIALGGWRTVDLLVAAAFVAAQPFTEWLLHVTVLHFRPRRLGRRGIDLFAARKHRAHHVDPDHVRLSFIQLRMLWPMIAGLGLIYAAAFQSSVALTAGAVSLALMLVYEWTHFLIHSPYVPRSPVYRYIWRAHRLHHFKNEHYWFGITSHLADHVLRTFPDRAAVETSPTVRRLFADA